MEQFRHIGEVVGSLKALMVLRDEIQINQRQCCLILDIFSLAMDTIAEEIRQNLKLEERNTKWKPLEFPLRELCRVVKEGELYIRQCLDSKDWFGKAIILSQNRDCVEFHIHNLLCYFPAVIEAIENAGEMSGLDPDEKAKKKLMLARKYDVEWNDPKLFQWRFGKQYLVPREICEQLENAWREDRWRLVEAIKCKTQKKTWASDYVSSFRGKVAFAKKSEKRLADTLLKKIINGSEINPITVLVGSKDYQVRRRLGRGKEFKEIQWAGQSFALRNFQGEREAHEVEVSTLLSLSHPNILQHLCGFYDEDKKEFSLIMEMMNKDLWTYMKENCGPRRQILFSIPVVVDLMLQMARGMEYLHSKNIHHGHLNPCNIFLKTRNSREGYFQAKVSGFGLSSLNNKGDNANDDINSLTWYAPEVLTELEQTGNPHGSTSEKADAYSFGMICFELLTGKVPFEDNHLQGDRTSQNIKAGERPLFPYRSPKYLVTLIKKCWQTDPSQRPTFSSICRILRYTKKFLAMNTEFHVINPELNQLELQVPPVDCCDIETAFLRSCSTERTLSSVSAVSQIPYEMFAYKVTEKGKLSQNNTKDKSCECEPQKDEPSSGFKSENEDQNTVCSDDNASVVEDQLPLSDDAMSVCSETPFRKTDRIKKPTQEKPKKDQGKSKLLATKSLPSSLSSRVLRTTKVNQSSLAPNTLSPTRRRPSLSSESERNAKGNQSPLMSIPSSSIRRKKYEGNVLNSKSSLRLKKGDQSPSTKYVSVADSLKMKRSQLTLNPSLSPGRLRRAKTETNLKGLPPIHPLNTSRTCTSRRRSNGHVSDFDSSLKMTKGKVSMSPLSPCVRRKNTSGHVSDSESSLVKERGSMSPFASSSLSPYDSRTCGHVSD